MTIIFLSQNVLNYDLKSYLLIGNKTLTLTNIYPYVALKHHPYFPVFLYIEAVAVKLKQLLGLDPIFFVKTIINIFDLANAFLIYKFFNNNFRKLILYLFNPVTLFIFSFHGQFDAIPIFFLLLTIYLINKKNFLWAVMTYSIAVAFKTWPIFFIFIIFNQIKNFFYIIPLFLVLITTILIYGIFLKVNLLLLFITILNYRSLFNEWGVGKLIKILFYPNQPQPPIFLQKIFLTLFLLVFFCYSIFVAKKSHKNIFEKIYLLLIFFYAFTVGFSIQYLSWIIPFLLILKFKEILITMILIFLYLFVYYLTWLHQSPSIVIAKDFFGITLWFYFFLLWLLKNKGLSKKTKP